MRFTLAVSPDIAVPRIRALPTGNRSVTVEITLSNDIETIALLRTFLKQSLTRTRPVHDIALVRTVGIEKQI